MIGRLVPALSQLRSDQLSGSMQNAPSASGLALSKPARTVSVSSMGGRVRERASADASQ